MILKNGIQPDAIYKGTTPIAKIYRGGDLVWQKTRLPAAYQEVEWIKTHEECAIFTGLHGAVGHVIRMQTNAISDDSGNTVFFSQDSNYGAMAVRQINGYWGIMESTYPDIVTSRTWRELDATFYDNNPNPQRIAVTYGGVHVDYTRSSRRSIPTKDLVIFASWSSSGSIAAPFNGRAKEISITYNGTLARHFVPCVRKSDNVVGMYDLCGSTCSLTGTPFYVNSGSGYFTTGSGT